MFPVPCMSAASQSPGCLFVLGALQCVQDEREHAIAAVVHFFSTLLKYCARRLLHELNTQILLPASHFQQQQQ